MSRGSQLPANCWPPAASLPLSLDLPHPRGNSCFPPLPGPAFLLLLAIPNKRDIVGASRMFDGFDGVG